jgi:hypothetical protein
MSIRDHISDLRWRAANGRTKVSNAWWRAAGRRIDGARQQASNEKNRKTIARGKAPRRDWVADEVKSRTPIYRKRINPATGRPHTDDRMMHGVRNEGLGKMKRSDDRAAAAERAAREYRERTSPGVRDLQRAHEDSRDRANNRTRPDPSRKHPGRAAR